MAAFLCHKCHKCLKLFPARRLYLLGFSKVFHLFFNKSIFSLTFHAKLVTSAPTGVEQEGKENERRTRNHHREHRRPTRLLRSGGKLMSANSVTLKELPEAVAAFAASGFNHEAMRGLMNLIAAQTPYIQKRFWKMSDAAYVAKAGA